MTESASQSTPSAHEPLMLGRGLIDLASDRLNGCAIVANDEFFAPKENLLRPGRGVFIEDKYTERGKWMDGWESRRRRTPGNDWCIIKLGAPGLLHAVTVDTNHFRGNHPEAFSLGAARATGPVADSAVESLAWTSVVDRTALRGHSENLAELAAPVHATHVRLNIFPDGGVARLRIWGTPAPDWEAIGDSGEQVDMASALLGARPVGSSDAFFSQPSNLLVPGRSNSMGDGWESRRRRGPGYDWCIIRLAARASVSQVLIDTNHFKGNFPDRCSVDLIDHESDDLDALHNAQTWRIVLPETPLGAHAEHRYDISDAQPATHIRLNIYPDGGVSRFRVFGRPSGEHAGD